MRTKEILMDNTCCGHKMNLSTQFSTDDIKSPLHKKSITNNNNATEIHTTYVRHNRQNIKNLVKILLALVFLLSACLIAFVVLYFGSYDKNEKIHHSIGSHDNRNDVQNSRTSGDKSIEKHSESGVCQTKECVQISARMIETMDFDEDPCEDFYKYACGGWIKKTPIPDSRIRYSRFEKLSEQNSIVIKTILNDLISGKRKPETPSLQKAATYYKACMNVKEIESVGIQPVQELIKSLGSWAVIDNSFDVTSWNAMKSLVKIQKDVAIAPLFNLYVGGDIKNSNENVLVFDQSGLMMPRESYLQNSSYHIRFRTAYRKMMKSIVKEMGADERGLQLMDEVFYFERNLAEITMSVMDRRDYRKIYRTMSLDEFANQSEIPRSWLKSFVDDVFSDTGKKIPLTERVVSFNVEYIKKAYKLFYNLSAEVQSSYLMWHVAKVLAPVSLGKYQDITDEFFMTAYGTKERQPRWEICISSTLRAFRNVLSRPFVEQVYDSTAKVMSTELIKAIKEVFTRNLDTMDWMDEQTRNYGKRKAELMLDNIGYPDYIMNNTALEIEYKGFNVEDGKHFLNYMESRKFENLKNYKKLGKPVDKSEWGIPPTTVNAYYTPTENKIGFPAGILQWPFYDKRAPRAVAYGAIGMVVGHEITHGFDDQGKDFTIEGNFDTWWTNHSANEFKKKSQCFIEQYGNFSIFGKNMKGKQTLGEDLADNGGIRQALQAYRDWVAKNGEEKQLPGLDLTAEQLYFLAFAQVWCTVHRESAVINQIDNGVHSLSNFRVIGTLQNSEDFSKAYQCKLGSRMNPKKKCRIW